MEEDVVVFVFLFEFFLLSLSSLDAAQPCASTKPLALSGGFAVLDEREGKEHLGEREGGLDTHAGGFCIRTHILFIHSRSSLF